MEKIKLATIVFLLIVTACATSRVTSSWRAKDVVPRNYKKIMVLGLIRSADRSIQETMENHMVGDLKNMGYHAVSSLEEYGPKAFDKMDEKTAIKKINNSGVDAIITIVLLDKEKERHYVSGRVYYSPYRYYYNHFWGYHTAIYRRIYEPGYYVTNTRYFWESNLYDVSTQELVYSVQTQSFNPGNSESLGHEYGQLIIKDMIEQNILQWNNQ